MAPPASGRIVQGDHLVLLPHQEAQQQRRGHTDPRHHGRPPSAPAPVALDPSVEIRRVAPDPVLDLACPVRGLWIVRHAPSQSFQMRSRLRHVRRDRVDGFEQLLDVLIQPLCAGGWVLPGVLGLGRRIE